MASVKQANHRSSIVAVMLEPFLDQRQILSNPHLVVVQVLSGSILASKLIYLSVAKYWDLVDVEGWSWELAWPLFLFVFAAFVVMI